jgi:alpha-beta hydrolase superfamily lysophospholipase
MRHAEGTLASKDGTTQLFWQSWQPDGDPKASVVLAHGIGEHSGRYQHVGEALTAANYALYAHDHRGFGKSEGERGKITRYDDLLDDLGLMISIAENADPSDKTFLYGHSMGGQIALKYAIQHPERIDGLIASGPHIRLRYRPPLAQVIMGRILASVSPGMVLDTTFDNSIISRDPAVVEAYTNDPLVHHRIALGLGKGMLDAPDYILRYADKLTMPLLLLHGAADRLTDPAGTQECHARAGTTDKTFTVYEGLHHEIHNEPEKERVLADIVKWLDEHV